jgi:hypothetical protein
MNALNWVEAIASLFVHGGVVGVGVTTGGGAGSVVVGVTTGGGGGVVPGALVVTFAAADQRLVPQRLLARTRYQYVRAASSAASAIALAPVVATAVNGPGAPSTSRARSSS